MARIKSFTYVLPFLNEESRIPFHLHIARSLEYFILVDAGSSDNSLDLFRKDPNLAHVNIVSLHHRGPRSADWYKAVIKLVNTEYFIISNCGHIYSHQLLKEFDAICSSRSVKTVKARKSHYIYNKQDYTMGNIILKPSLYELFINFRLIKDPILISPPTVYSKNIFDWSNYKIHDEMPLQAKYKNSFIVTKSSIATFRDEDSASIELKHCNYSTVDAKDQLRVKKEHITAFVLLTTYFKHFYFYWLVKGSIHQGVSGFISSHYRASYHLSVKIRKWEMQCGFNKSKILELNACIRNNLINQ